MFIVLYEVSTSSFSVILLLIYLSGRPGQKCDISVSWGFVCVCAQNTTFALNQTRANFFGEIVPSSKLGVSHIQQGLSSKVFSGALLWIDCQVIESWREPRVHILALALIFMDCPGLVCTLPVDRLSRQFWR